MADQKKRTPNPAVSDPRPGTTHERDFGRTDRYDNKDEAGFNVRKTGNDSERDEDPDDPASDVNRDE